MNSGFSAEAIRPECAGPQPGHSQGRDGIDQDVVFQCFKLKRVHETDDSQLRSEDRFHEQVETPSGRLILQFNHREVFL